jgi:hypothetical protein
VNLREAITHKDVLEEIQEYRAGKSAPGVYPFAIS